MRVGCQRREDLEAGDGGEVRGCSCGAGAHGRVLRVHRLANAVLDLIAIQRGEGDERFGPNRHGRVHVRAQDLGRAEAAVACMHPDRCERLYACGSNVRGAVVATQLAELVNESRVPMNLRRADEFVHDSPVRVVEPC